MIEDFDKKLESYAEVAIKIGLNLRAGQKLLIFGVQVAHAPLVRHLVAKAYQAGARQVDVLWTDDEIRLARYKYAPRDSFGEYPQWMADVRRDYAANGDALLTVYAANPDLLEGQDIELIGEAQKAAAVANMEARNLTTANANNWCIITAPLTGWTETIYPDMTPEAAEETLWETLFKFTRLDHDDPVAAWEAHIKDLQNRSDYLNSKAYDALHYTAPGTDLTVGLPPGHIWVSADSVAQNNIRFVANLPTEEAFTIPDRMRVDGVVSSTKVLNVGSGTIENFQLTFKEGKVVDLKAEKGEVLLRQTIDMDENAGRLGEVALVPHSSPISQSGRVFNNILLDENASNHLALGTAYKFNLKGGVQMSDEEFMAAGGNISLIHVDFMIGSGEMNVDGLTKDGKAEPIMRNGEWAFEV